MKRLFAALAGLVVLLAFTTASTAQDRQRNRSQQGSEDRAGAFDFYVLSLSWSPTFCASDDGGRNRQQCGTDKRFRFVVHGLWPQYETGFPDFCRSSEPDRVPRQLGEKLFDIMPSMGLIGHQWRKHGSCTGLDQATYFDTVRKAFEHVKLPADLAGGQSPLKLSPDAIEQAFMSANPGLSRRGIAASCEGEKLDEIRICLSKDLQFRDCAEVDRRGCRIGQVTLPPAR